MVIDDPLRVCCACRQASGEAVGCQNGGLCVGKDDCHCIHTLSVLSIAHPHLPRGVTGWSGTDCSMPMCTQVTHPYNDPRYPGIFFSCTPLASLVPFARSTTDNRPMVVLLSVPQGYYDPFCADLPQAPGNEGCYRCANGGNCTAVRLLILTLF
jgi:hypothetical protein